MENFLLALNVVLPIAIIILIGIVIKRLKWVNDEHLTVMNKLIFRIFMSTLLFMNVYKIGNLDFISKDNLYFFLFPVICVLLIYFIAWLFYFKRITDKKKLSVLIQGVYRGNFALFGIPIAETLYGEAGLSTVSMLIGFIIPLFNVLAVITLEYYSGKEISWIKIIKSIFKNPLIIGTISGMIFLKFQIQIPKPIHKTLVDLGRVATPLAFVVLGASLNFSSALKNIKNLISMNILRLVINPFIMLVGGHFLNFNGVQIASFLALSACPTAVASFTMAKEMNADADLAAEIVASTTILSIFTVFMWIFILKELAWI